MAIKKVKQLMEDLQNDTHVVLPANVAIADSATLATSAGNSGTAAVATLATKATSASYAGTARVAHYGSSGTSAIA